MKAVIESREDLYFIRIYGTDGLLCDAYAVEQLEFTTEKNSAVTLANSQDTELALWFLN